jgi:hypothetical protein
MRVTKLDSGLRLVFQTAAPAKPGNIYSFSYFHDQDDERGGLIQVRYRDDGSLTADASTEPTQYVSQLPTGSAKLRGNEVVLTVPDEFLDPTNRFTWFAIAGYSISDVLEVDDWVPDQPSDPLRVRTAHYR